ncbi:hypothetical protein CGOTTB_11440 [Corynebacterium gottingense]|nr:hypothetical protein CGOTTB_11440 [Corynebacterium gottingense]
MELAPSTTAPTVKPQVAVWLFGQTELAPFAPAPPLSPGLVKRPRNAHETPAKPSKPANYPPIPDFHAASVACSGRGAKFTVYAPGSASALKHSTPLLVCPCSNVKFKWLKPGA